ncbi:FAD binding domain-containing protein [Stachybotrys elegans]|uniref:FAD binding domain-containing protein n=1 Tax=Stachybotrys elegans TaxID=80388 RepID=A0A8K0WKP9_9HYPO|nr:FAD binding domain-containing protein [Stachybotrys elegans]
MSTSSENIREVDVAIVGGLFALCVLSGSLTYIVIGGPTGLFTGLLLHRLGVSVCILDAKAGSLDLGRADALNARTQQYLEVAGLLDELLPLGLKCNTSSTFADGEFKSRQNKWWVGIEHALHKNFLMIGQPVIEAMLNSRLKGLVYHGQDVVNVAEDEEHVHVTTSTGFKVRSKYLLAADGARSFVRNALGIDFTGTKPEMLWAVLDTFIESDFPVCPEIITFQAHGQSRVSWIPRERGLSRFYVLLEGEVSQKRAEESIKKHMAPHSVEFKQTEWYSTFDVKERIASSFISKNGNGRVLLAGDAAHVHSVNGGQGLNTGLSDAFALAWRLAMVTKHDLPEAASKKLIQSYDLERRTTAKNVIDVAAALVRDTMREAKEYVATIERNAGYITGMGVSYEGLNSPLVKESSYSFWTAGARCPDVVVTGSEQPGPSWLYSHVEYGKFIVLSIGQVPHPYMKYQHVLQFISIFASPPEGSNNPAQGEDRDTHSLSGKMFRADWVLPEDNYIIVIRPDMYIGYIATCEQGWQDYIASICV